MGVFRTKFVTENVEQHPATWRKGEREGEAQNTTLHLHLIQVLMAFWQQPNDSANQYGPNNDYPISLHRVNHKTFATLQNGSVDPKKLQSPKFICIDDILAFATYINVDDMDKLLQRNFDMHITNTPGNQPSRSILPI